MGSRAGPVALALGLGFGPVAWAGPTIDCPKDSVLRVDLTEDGGTRQWCLGDGGLGDGPVEERDAAGGLRLVGRLRAGEPAGVWRRPLPGGLVSRGTMGLDGPTGQWLTLAPGVEEPVASVIFGRGQAAPAGLTLGPAPLRFRLDGLAPQQVVAAGDTVWLVGRDQALRVDPATGAVLDGVAVLTGLAGDLVGLLSGDLLGISLGGDVFAVRDGRPLRLHTPKGSTHAAPVGGALEAVVLRDGAGHIERRALDTGRLAWRSRLSMAALPPVVLDEAGLALAARGDTLWALDLESGAVRWSTRLSGALRAVVADGRGGALALTVGGALSAVSAEAGGLRWTVPAGGQGLVALQPDGDVLWLMYEDRLHSVELRGGAARFPAVSPPEGGVYTALGLGAAGVRVCALARGDADQRCAPIDALSVPWRAPAGALVRGGAPLAADTLWLASGSALLAVDPSAAAMAQGLPELGLDESEPEAAELVWWATPLPELADALYEGELEAAELRVVGDAEAACPDEVGVLWAGAQPAADPELLALGPIPALLPRVALRPPVGAGPLQPAAPWTATLLAEQTTVHFWVPWWPVIESVVPADNEERLLAAVGAAMRCEGGAVALRGEVVVHDGLRRHLLSGRLELVPEPVEVDGVAGCGLWLAYNGQAMGLWSSPEAPTWAPAHFTWDGASPDDIGVPEGIPLPLGMVSGAARLSALRPWGEAPVTTEAGGLLAEIDPRDVLGASWVLRRPSAPLEWSVDGENVLARLPLAGMALAVGDGAVDGPEAALSHDEWWRFEADAPLDGEPGLAADEARARVLWRRAGCGEVDGPAVSGPAQQPGASEGPR